MRRLATLVDFALIAAASAAFVVLLGGGRTFSLGGVALVLKSAAPLAVIAGGLVALRLLHWRHLPLLPSIRSEPLRFEEEHQRIVTGAPVTPRVAWYGLAAIAGSIVWVVPHLLNLRDVPDPGDPIFSAWRIAALAHQLAADPRHLWDGNIFYPLPLTLTYSDSTFLQAILGAPFVLAGVDPLIVMNALMVASFPLRGLAYYFVAWRLTGDPQAAVVAALAGAWAPFHADHYSQLELQWTAFVPLALFLLMRLLAAPGWKTGMAFGAAVAAQCLSCMYVAVMLVSALVPFGAVLVVAWRVRPSRRLAAGLAAAAMVLLPIVGLLGSAYMKSRDTHGDRGRREVADGSAWAREYRHATERLVTHHWQLRDGHHPERELFPGFTPVTLAAVALAPPLVPGVIATLTAGAAAFDWSLGFKGLTYDELYRLSPVYRGMRVPARFTSLVEAALALLTAYGAHRLLRNHRSAVTRGALCALMCGAVLVDLRIDPYLQPYPRGVPPIYRHVKKRMVLAEMPAGHTLDYMYYSTRHWARLLDGYSGFGPDLGVLTEAERAFPAPEAVASFRELGATDLTFNCAFEKLNRPVDADCQHVFDALDKNPSLGLVARESWRGSEVRLYRYR
jgi:hypothetical protein